MSDPNRCRRCGVDLTDAQPGGLCDACSEDPTESRWPSSVEQTTMGDDRKLAGPGGGISQELGSVKLIEVVGRGASGVVYRGYDQVLGRPVAVKFLIRLAGTGSTSQQRFLDEARAAAAVRHPNLVEIHQAGMDGQTPYLILQFVEGETLGQILQRHGPLSIGRVAAILQEMAMAVDELHSHGIIHRDIKPSNILLDSDGHVHLSDLGVSLRRLERGSLDTEVAGTPEFMAPEVFEGRASPRSDIYALGVTLFELLTGEAPFEGTSLEELSRKHKEEQLPAGLLAGRQVPPGVIEVIGRAMHKQPAFRYKSAGDLSRAFVAALGRPLDPAKARVELAVLLSRICGQAAPGDDPRGPLVEGSLSSTISHIADLKRQRRRSGEQALPAPAPERLSVSGTIDADVPCVACAYDLRLLPADGKCPECGRAISDSLDPARIIFAEPAWLQDIVLGHSLAMLSLGLDVVCFIFLQFAFFWSDGGFAVLSLFCLLPLLFGVWLMTHPRLTGAVRWGWLYRAMVAVLVAAAVFLAVPLALGGLLGARIDLTRTAPAVAPAGAPGLPEWLAIGEVAAPIAALFAIGALARSLPERQRQRRTRRAALVLVTSSAFFCALLTFNQGGWPPDSSSDLHAHAIKVGYSFALQVLFVLTITVGYGFYFWILSESRLTLLRLREKRLTECGVEPPLDPTLPCVGCRYDLRGLPPDGNCPECGLSIERSLDPRRTVFAKRKWLYGVVLGIGLVFVSLTFCTAALVLNWVMLSSPGQWWQATWLHRLVWLQGEMLHTAYAWNLKGYIHELNDKAFGLESVVCLAPAVLGIWLITRPRSGWHSRARSVCRYGGLTTFGLAMFLATAALFGVSLGGWIVSGLGFDWQAPVRFGIGPVLAMVEVALAVALLWYLGCVVSSVPEPAAPRFIRRSAMLSLWALIILMGLIRIGELLGGNGTLHAGMSGLTRIIVVLPTLERLAALTGWTLFVACLWQVGRMLLRLARLRRPRPDVMDAVGAATRVAIFRGAQGNARLT